MTVETKAKQAEHDATPRVSKERDWVCWDCARLMERWIDEVRAEFREAGSKDVEDE
jgi:hypothetical protein